MFDDQLEQPVEQEQVQPETIEISQEAQEASKKQAVSTDESWKSLREKAERAERERDEYARYFQQIQMAQQQAQYQQQQPQQEEQEYNPADDELLEGKHFKAIKKKYADLEKKYAAMEEKAYASIVEARVRTQFSDWDTVVNEYTVKALRESEPELAASLHANPDVFSKSVATYKAIKRLGLNETTAYDADKELAQRNAAKPRTLTSIVPQQGETPLSRANAFASGLTDELKAQLRKEMEEARKRY